MAGEPFDNPSSAGSYEQEREYYARKIATYFPERAADPLLVYGDPKKEYFYLVNEGLVPQDTTGMQGPKGDKGDKGATGEKGATGDRGPTGATGPTGPKGDKGDQGLLGPTGPKGDKGDPGIQGPEGPIGLTGPKGDTGAKGATGATGPKGDPGIQGLKGDTGDKGATGATGPAGPKGDQGIQGPKGDQGIQGPKGDKGDRGVTQRIVTTAGKAIYNVEDNGTETLIAGDTGWRNISGLLPTTGMAFTGKVLMRRVMNKVYIHVDNLKSANGYGDVTFLTMPSGYRPHVSTNLNPIRAGLLTEVTGINAKVVSPHATTAGVLQILYYMNDLALCGSFEYFTNEAWPTSLPGTAV